MYKKYMICNHLRHTKMKCMYSTYKFPMFSTSSFLSHHTPQPDERKPQSRTCAAYPNQATRTLNMQPRTNPHETNTTSDEHHHHHVTPLHPHISANPPQPVRITSSHTTQKYLAGSHAQRTPQRHNPCRRSAECSRTR